MILRGNISLAGSKGVFIPDVTNLTEEQCEAAVEKAVLEGAITVVQCHPIERGPTDWMAAAIRAGAVPLRWGAPRVLLATPEQARAMQRGEEISRPWRLWRYQFDPEIDAFVDGSPWRAEKYIRANLAAGRNWSHGLRIEEARRG